ncbi:LLM class flavin-dependent oxidoreductase [Paenibacillus pabuli]|uniref:LLM class flavin-dependent oxidoreductase n=1 Tax=Paenibacillus pabuli TaxID=1472 RepID=UPI003CE788F9
MSFNITWYADMPLWEEEEGASYIKKASVLMENKGFNGALFYYLNDSLDPWTSAGLIIQSTKRLTPIIAVQPYSMPPFTAAKIIHALAHYFGRRVEINLVSGGQTAELEEVGDRLNHEERYERLIEYGVVLRSLLSTNEPLTFAGKYYSYQNLCMHSAVDPTLMPRIFCATTFSSPHGISAAKQIADVVLTFPGPVNHFQQFFCNQFVGSPVELGIRIGLITRSTESEAFQAANRNMDHRLRKLEKAHLIRDGWTQLEDDTIYFPRRQQAADCPCLVGSYEQVATYIRKYAELGVKHIIIGASIGFEEAEHYEKVFEMINCYSDL